MTDSQNFVKAFGQALAARGKLAATVESYTRDAASFLSYLAKFGIQLKDLEPDHLFAYQDHLRDELNESINSIRRSVIGIRQFFRFLVEGRELSSSPFDLVPIPARDESLPPLLEGGELERIIGVALDSHFALKAHRDAAIVALLAFEGIKASELIKLRWNDFIEDKGLGSLRVSGLRARVLNLSGEASRHCANYRRHFRSFDHPLLKHHERHNMFIAFKGRDSLTPSSQISRHGVKFMLYELGAKIGHDKLNTEMLRHFATQFQLSRGRSTEEIMQHFGLRRAGNIAKHLACHIPGQKLRQEES